MNGHIISQIKRINPAFFAGFDWKGSLDILLVTVLNTYLYDILDIVVIIVYI